MLSLILVTRLESSISMSNTLLAVPTTGGGRELEKE